MHVPWSLRCVFPFDPHQFWHGAGSSGYRSTEANRFIQAAQQEADPARHPDAFRALARIAATDMLPLLERLFFGTQPQPSRCRSRAGPYQCPADKSLV